MCPFISNTPPCLKELCQLWDKEISNCVFVALSKRLNRIESQLDKETEEEAKEVLSLNE